jgi:DNA-binding transcriptional LysR family regulator
MLDELKALVAFAETGSLHRAAGRLHLTPSAVTRQIQRVEASLGAPLLDRETKPPRLTPVGRRVLDRARELLRDVDDLRATASGDTEPSGAFRLGLAHALAEPSFVPVIQRFATRFPGIRPILSSDATSSLLQRLRSADLEAAVILLPHPGTLPAGVMGSILATERFTIVRARDRDQARGHAAADLAGPWVVNPLGCVIRDSLRAFLEPGGGSLRVSAEVHNLELQLSLVRAGVGLGVVPARFLAQYPRRSRLEIVRPSGWKPLASIALVRGGHLGPFERAVVALEEMLRDHLRHPRRSPVAGGTNDR